MESELQQIVARRLEELGLGPVEAATRGGLERTYIRDIVEGKKKSLRTDKVEALAKALQLDANVILHFAGHGTYEPEFRKVTVKGYVQAGVFAETWEWHHDDQYQVSVPADKSVRPFKLYAAETRGPSMNRRYPEGTVLIFTDMIETHEQIEVGKRYIVERERSDGLREATVKKLWRDDNGRFWLLPESDDPLHQAPLPLEGGEDDTIRIVGRVRYAVSRE